MVSFSFKVSGDGVRKMVSWLNVMGYAYNTRVWFEAGGSWIQRPNLAILGETLSWKEIWLQLMLLLSQIGVLQCVPACLLLYCWIWGPEESMGCFISLHLTIWGKVSWWTWITPFWLASKLLGRILLSLPAMVGGLTVTVSGSHIGSRDLNSSLTFTENALNHIFSWAIVI